MCVSGLEVRKYRHVSCSKFHKNIGRGTVRVFRRLKRAVYDVIVKVPTGGLDPWSREAKVWLNTITSKQMSEENIRPINSFGNVSRSEEGVCHSLICTHISQV